MIIKESIKRKLDDCYEAYQLCLYEKRYDRFKEKKKYFLEGLSEMEIEKVYRHFLFFHYALWHKVYPKVSKEEIIKYYEQRKSEVSSQT